jgi:hypothetical protein
MEPPTARDISSGIPAVRRNSGNAAENAASYLKTEILPVSSHLMRHTRGSRIWTLVLT